MKQKIRLGDCYTLTKHKLKCRYIQYISLLAVLTTMCLYARAQRPESSGPVLSGIDTTTTTRDTIAIEEVEINTGYQRIPKERATGSFVFVDSALFNRAFSTDVLSRLEGVVSGLLFNRVHDRPDDIDMTLRGPGTFQAADQPLIILDNFEYQGDLNNINPNDVANITILKDAAATSIWGAKAGNGVIVITTKSGRYNQPTRLSASSNVAVKGRPDLYGRPMLSSSDFIDLEQDLFERGYYDFTLNNINKPAVTPVVWLLAKQRSGEVSASIAQTTIEVLQSIDTRKDINGYLMQPAISQQHALSFTGGGHTNQYYASAGWDQNRHNNVGNDYNRLSLTFNNTFGLLQNRLEIKTGVYYTYALSTQNGEYPVSNMNYPYAQLADADGNALEIFQYNPGFIDQVGDGQLLDWRYRPLDELEANDNQTALTDLKVNLNLGYRPTPWLKVGALYQYANGNNARKDHHQPESYFARNLINQFSSFGDNGEVLRPIPLGGILDAYTTSYYSHRVRGQADLAFSWGPHEIRALLGSELSNDNHLTHANRYYGYNEQNPASIPVDAVNRYTSMITGLNTLRISTGESLRHLTNRFVSFYGNGSYGYENKYWLTASIRQDGSNLFGVRTNQRWSPFYSIGAKWLIDRETFYRITWLPQLSARVTYGSSGNVDRSVTAYLVARSAGTNSFSRPMMTIVNPPNPDLKWETINTFNAAIDFTLFASKQISGSVEGYIKRGKDLMGSAELPAVSGRLEYVGNTAAMKTRGLDITVNTQNLSGPVSWQSQFLYSAVSNTVTEYRVTPTSNSNYLGGYRIVGKPIAAIYAYRWGGLNPENGNPRGYAEGELSEDYAAIIGRLNLTDLAYIGSSSPTQFGSIRNTFAWRGISLSFNVLFKFGHHFRADLLNYGLLYGGAYMNGAAQFVKRWQRPGDESVTSVPSMIYPANPLRDMFYTQSEPAFKSADHIRLQDVRIGYRIPAIHLEVYAVAQNLGILWKAVDGPYDPDFGYTNRVANISAGFKITF